MKEWENWVFSTFRSPSNLIHLHVQPHPRSPNPLFLSNHLVDLQGSSIFTLKIQSLIISTIIPTILFFFSLVFRLQNVAPIRYTEEAINKRIYWKKKVKKTPSKLMPDSYTWLKYDRKQIKGSIRYLCILQTSSN